jgi:2',3'-cyclic-nucleotide 2'-phosphodiesterase
MSGLNAILLGDVIGASGIQALVRELPGLRKKYSADIVVANGENAAAGFGLTYETSKAILEAGVDVITSGNHVWQKREFWPILEKKTVILRPANYPDKAPGTGLAVFEKNGTAWAVLNLQGREQMGAIDCPFRTADRILAGLKITAQKNPQLDGTPVVIVDFHAESTEEKEALGLYLDGRCACVAGTHTHVQTADERILPGGTAYITDLGMTGPKDSIIGMNTDICVRRVLTQMPLKMEVEEGRSRIQGLAVSIDPVTHHALRVERILL